LIFFGLGIYTILFRKQKAIGLATFFISIFWFYTTTSILMPFLSGKTVNFLSLTPKSVFFFSGLSPIELFKNLFWPFKKIETIITLFASFAFLPLLSGLAWLTTPATFINRFVSNDWSRWSTHFQYSATIAPLLAISTILAVENIKKFFKKIETKRLMQISIVAILVGTIWANRPGWDPPFTTPPLLQIFKRSFWSQSENQKTAHQILKTISPDASVATNTFYVPHLINRKEIFEFPNVFIEPDIYFLSTLDPYPLKNQEEFNKELLKIKENKKYELIFDKEGLLLFNKKPD